MSEELIAQRCFNVGLIVDFVSRKVLGQKVTHLSFDKISQRELDLLCDKVNFLMGFPYNGWIISNSMGEILCSPVSIERRKVD